LARTRLFEAERDARLSTDDARRANVALRDAAGALAAAPTFADITWAVIHHAAALFGASSAVLAVATPHRPLLEVFVQGDGSGELTHALVHVDAALPGPHAARTNEPLYFQSTAERLSAFPRTSIATDERGAAIFIPQESQRPGYVAIFLGQDRPISLTERDLTVTFARLVFQAVDRAALLEAQLETARLFQQRLLDAPPFVHADVTIATRYLAGANGVHIGGDWHDALTLRNGRVLLVVGDVVGRGLVAATAMAQLRNAVRAFAQIDPDPTAILTRLDTFISDTSATTFATAAIVLLDPADGSLRYALAGHLPPLVVGERETTWLGEGLSPPLGLCTRSSTRPGASGHLADGDQLLLYTDGLIERRGEPLQTSLDRLMSVARSLRSAHPERFATTVLDHAGVTPDDTALVVARIRRSVHAPLQVVLPSRPAELRNVRAQFADWLNGTMLTAEAKDGLVLTVSEAIANSIEHAHHFDPSLTIDVRGIMTTSGEVEITVSDQGMWHDPTYADTASRGRGLPLIRALTSQAEVLQRGNGSTLIVRYIQPEPLRR
jgi:anti-sigma regulatory factor (Ser/Thr protein kinase)